MSLTGEQLQKIARTTANLLPGVSNGRPFTKNLDVYKVVNKVFLIVTDDPDELIITLKIEPDRASDLQREYPTISRGRYLDKEHWTSVGAGTGITRRLIEDLVEGSYELVRKSLPEKSQLEDR